MMKKMKKMKRISSWWFIVRYNGPAIKMLKSHHTCYTLKTLAARTNFKNRGVHEGSNWKFLKIKNQIENNKYVRGQLCN